MAAKKPLNYKALITQSPGEIEQNLLDLKVEQAQNYFDQGLLSIKQKKISAEAEMKQASNEVSKAESAIETAKRSEPDQLVQKLVDAIQNMKQAEANLEVKRELYNEYEALYTRMIDIKKELFG